MVGVVVGAGVEVVGALNQFLVGEEMVVLVVHWM